MLKIKNEITGIWKGRRKIKILKEIELQKVISLSNTSSDCSATEEVLKKDENFASSS